MSPKLLVPLASLCAAALCSCASVSVSKTEIPTARPPKTKPTRIYVRPFEFVDENVRADREGEAYEAFKRRVSDHLSKALATRLTKTVAPAEVVASDARLPRGNAWVVGGRISRLNQGSRILRAVAGMGLGATKLETAAWIEDLAHRPPRKFLIVETTGGSNVSPGALGTAGYFVSGATALLSTVHLMEGVRTGVSFDATRTAREITAATSEFLYQQRAIPHSEALAPKRLGRWSPDFWPLRRAPEKLPEGRVTVEPAQ
jgi:hypothetical protein